VRESARRFTRISVVAACFGLAAGEATQLSFGREVEVLWSCFACAKSQQTSANQRDDQQNLTRATRCEF
jgi:hypothetical protein